MLESGDWYLRGRSDISSSCYAVLKHSITTGKKIGYIEMDMID